jgi:transcriptional regulator of acetoin/glycerol metabolism
VTTTSLTVSLDEASTRADAGASPQLIVLIPGGRLAGPSSRHVLVDLDTVLVGRGDRGADRRAAGGLRRLELRLPDRAMSSQHARMIRLHGSWIVEDADSKNGTRVNGGDVHRAALRDGDLIEVGTSFLLYRDAEPAPGPLDLSSADVVAPAAGLATFSGELARSFAALTAVAPSRVPVVILGDSGSGKEVAARAVHHLSARRGAFVPVNCGALPATLVEAQLFGWKKGSFTGAVDDGPGHVRSADGGTLFLDEIAELPAAAQATLLRVLQEGEVMPVGASRAVAVDVRVAAATHQDLPARVDAGEFRRDLWARLAGFVFELPALAERREDLGLLVAALAERLRAAPDTTVTPAAARLLLKYAWPLNIRELAMTLEAALALSRGAAIDVAQLPVAVRTEPIAAPSATPAPLSASEVVLRDQLVATLSQHDGNVAAVARAMGKGRMQIHRWLRRFGLELEQFRRRRPSK